MHHRALILILTLCAVAAPTSLADAATFPSDTTAILSGDDTLRAPLPAPTSDAFSERQAMSQDGRFVAFVSTSDGLSGDDDDSVENVFVDDRSTGTITLASRRSGSGE